MVSLVVIESLFPLAIVSLIIFLLFQAYHKKAPSLDARLEKLDARLAVEPDNAALHMLSAELSVRVGANWNAIKSLEKAFVLNASKEQVEPTFWQCYRNITDERYGSLHEVSSEYHPSQKLWRRLHDEAPKLMASIATELWECETYFKRRESSPLLESDQASRLRLFNSVDS